MRRIFNYSLFGVWKCSQTRSFVFDILLKILEIKHELMSFLSVMNYLDTYSRTSKTATLGTEEHGQNKEVAAMGR